MRIVIAGAGTLGVAWRTYTRDEHDVLVVEQSRARGSRRRGGARREGARRRRRRAAVLLEAGVDRADVFLASTGHDEDNLVASLLAKNEFKVARSSPRAQPRNRWLYNRSWGVDVAIDSARSSPS